MLALGQARLEEALDYYAEKSSRRAQISWSACLPNRPAEFIPLRRLLVPAVPNRFIPLCGPSPEAD